MRLISRGPENTQSLVLKNFPIFAHFQDADEVLSDEMINSLPLRYDEIPAQVIDRCPPTVSRESSYRKMLNTKLQLEWDMHHPIVEQVMMQFASLDLSAGWPLRGYRGYSMTLWVEDYPYSSPRGEDDEQRLILFTMSTEPPTYFVLLVTRVFKFEPPVDCYYTILTKQNLNLKPEGEIPVSAQRRGRRAFSLAFPLCGGIARDPACWRAGRNGVTLLARYSTYITASTFSIDRRNKKIGRRKRR
ncbi:hypothetical protein C8R47DRAFT_1078513 [Mycena vitilis]|nr:hypothetical protein C8R47DRAFT_1078513 [Mycena vitilis]